MNKWNREGAWSQIVSESRLREMACVWCVCVFILLCVVSSICIRIRNIRGFSKWSTMKPFFFILRKWLVSDTQLLYLLMLVFFIFSFFIISFSIPRCISTRQFFFIFFFIFVLAWLLLSNSHLGKRFLMFRFDKELVSFHATNIFFFFNVDPFDFGWSSSLSSTSLWMRQWKLSNEM